jgi:hypothetical protein
MIHITIALPDQVAQQYYQASEKLTSHYKEIGQAPDAHTLMRFALASFHADDIARHFDFTLRNLTGAPMPDEAETWIFSPGFDSAP